MMLRVNSRGAFKPPQCNVHSLTAKEASRMPVRHLERHRTEHIGWLRAVVLGANDGILSTASLVLGVAAAHGTRSNILVAGGAGLCRWPPVSTFLSTRRQITLIQVNVIAITQDAISLHAKIAHIAERHRRAVRLL